MMTPLWRFPGIIFLFSFVVLWLATETGVFFRNRSKTLGEAERNDLSVIVPASLTLLGLIIGFSFSMSTGRYDLRKHYEEEEANAIGTEYVRADLVFTTAKYRSMAWSSIRLAGSGAFGLG